MSCEQCVVQEFDSTVVTVTCVLLVKTAGVMLSEIVTILILTVTVVSVDMFQFVFSYMTTLVAIMVMIANCSLFVMFTV